jgi:hypothetical protein
LSAHGDPLEVLDRVVNFEAFRPTLDTALGYSDGAKGGRPPYDPVTMLKVLVLAAQNNVSDARIVVLRPAAARPTAVHGREKAAPFSVWPDITGILAALPCSRAMRLLRQHIPTSPTATVCAISSFQERWAAPVPRCWHSAPWTFR